MDRSDLETEIGYKLGDPSHDRWPTSRLRTLEEEAQTAIQATTGAVKTIETLTPTDDTAEVTVDASTIDITRVTLTDSDGDIHILNGRSRDDLDFYHPNWPNEDADEPKEFMYDASNHQLILYPKPSSSYAVTNGLKVWEVQIPTALTGDSSEPFEANAAMQAYSMAIVHWVTAYCFMDDGTPESLAKARFHLSNDLSKPGQYETYIRKINAKFNAPSSMPERIKWAPQGARLSGQKWPSKEYPFA